MTPAARGCFLCVRNQTYWQQFFPIYNFLYVGEKKAMDTQLEKLSDLLSLSPYQKFTLAAGLDKYNISRLIKRGGVLYVPRRSHGLLGVAADFFMGRRADLIGRNKTLLHAQRRIKFYAAGYHCVRIGRFMYYADASGAAISRRAFLRGIEAAR